MELQSLANIIREDVKGTKSVLKLVRKKKTKAKEMFCGHHQINVLSNQNFH